MTIGIIGDGQLALMLAESFEQNHISFLCLGSSENSPMKKAFPLQTTLDENHFQKSCDQFTLENEFLSVDALKDLLKSKSTELFPDLNSYSFFANKISQRTLYQELKIPSPRWQALESIEEMDLVTDEWKFPFILKASAGGYDGKGVKVIRDEKAYRSACLEFGLDKKQKILVEEMIDIKQELAQGFVQDREGRFTLLPLVETVQVDGICQYVYYPPVISSDTQSKIKAILEKLIKKPLIGIFNFEFFLDHKGEVFINEGAPRPHNSQHLTIDASNFSQFDLVGLYMTKNPPREELSTKNSSMVNILGRSQGKDYHLSLPDLGDELQVQPKLYLKESCSVGRKMGHVNIVDQDKKFDLRDISQKIFKEYFI